MTQQHLAWRPGAPATDAANDPIPYGNDPHAPGGLSWTIAGLRERIAMIEAVIAHNQAERAQALEELAAALACREVAA